MSKGNNMAEKMKENKVVRGYSLAPTNIEWLARQALALSIPGRRISDSLYLDNLITRERAEEARKRSAKTPLSPSTVTSPQIGERDLGGGKRKVTG